MSSVTWKCKTCVAACGGEACFLIERAEDQPMARPNACPWSVSVPRWKEVLEVVEEPEEPEHSVGCYVSVSAPVDDSPTSHACMTCQKSGETVDLILNGGGVTQLICQHWLYRGHGIVPKCALDKKEE